MYAEPFALEEHISSCAYRTNFGNQCPIYEAGVVFFTTVAACSEDGVSMINFHYNDETYAAHATVEDLIGMDITCYNSFADFSQLFTS